MTTNPHSANLDSRPSQNIRTGLERRGLIFEVLKYLLQNTSPENGKSVKDLSTALGVSEKPIRAHLEELRKMENILGLGISVNQIKDMPEPPRGEKNTNWYASSVIGKSGFRLIRDSLALFRVDPDDIREIIDCIAALAGIAPQDYPRFDCYLDSDNEPSIMLTVSTLEQAISDRQKISFAYTSYNIYGGLDVRKKESYEYYPYFLGLKNGFYYLLCGKDPAPAEENITFFLVDRIKNVEIIKPEEEEILAAPQSDSAVSQPDNAAEKSTADYSFNFIKYLGERPYPYSGEAHTVTYRVTGSLDSTYAWFPSPGVKQEEPGIYRVTVRAESHAMTWWALQYLDSVEVLEPEELRQQIHGMLVASADKYASVETAPSHIESPSRVVQEDPIKPRKPQVDAAKTASDQNQEKPLPVSRNNASNAGGTQKQQPNDTAHHEDTFKGCQPEVENLPPLTKEEEVLLFERLEAGKKAEQRLKSMTDSLSVPEKTELRQTQQEGNQAKNTLIVSNLRLVVHIVNKWRRKNSQVSPDDLLSEGNLALIRAVEKFNYTRDSKFSSYATKVIRNALFDFVAKQAGFDKKAYLDL